MAPIVPVSRPFSSGVAPILYVRVAQSLDVAPSHTVVYSGIAQSPVVALHPVVALGPGVVSIVLMLFLVLMYSVDLVYDPCVV